MKSKKMLNKNDVQKCLEKQEKILNKKDKKKMRLHTKDVSRRWKIKIKRNQEVNKKKIGQEECKLIMSID